MLVAICSFLIAGVWSWPFWMPSAISLRAGVIGLGLLSLLIRRPSLKGFAVFSAAFLFGNLCVARIPHPDFPQSGTIVGEVMIVRGRKALVSTEIGRVWFDFPAALPPATKGVAVVYRPGRPKAVWPGDADFRLELRRSRAAHRRVISWLPFPDHSAPVFEESAYSRFEHGGILWALATGQRHAVDPSLKKLLRMTGTSHILAISGLHIGMISGAVHLITKKICGPLFIRGIWVANFFPPLLCVLSAVLYGGFSGWQPSAQRSVIMISMISISVSLGRAPRVWSVLFSAAALIALIEPSQLDSIGYQLSFSAVAGILLILPRFQRLLPPDTNAFIRRLILMLAVSIGASLGTLPVVAFHFQLFSPVGPLANLFALPLLAFLILPFSILPFLLPSSIGDLSLNVAQTGMDLFKIVMELLLVEPVNVAVGPIGCLFLFACLLLRKRPLIAALAYFFILCIPSRTPDELLLSFLPVGQGDAALIEWPDGRKWLVDGGPPGFNLSRYLLRRRIRHLDAIFISHPHPDHIGGLLDVADKIEIGRIWATRPPRKNEKMYGELWRKLKSKSVDFMNPLGGVFQDFTVLHPLDGWRSDSHSAVNEESLVFSISHGGRTILFTGDIQSKAEAHLLDSVGHADILKVAHHGSKTSSTKAFLEAVDPEFAVISCGKMNRYRHPNPEVLERLKNLQIYRTDLHGLLEMKIDMDGKVDVEFPLADKIY